MFNNIHIDDILRKGTPVGISLITIVSSDNVTYYAYTGESVTFPIKLIDI